MLEGVRVAEDADVIAFFDADLLGLEAWHVNAIVAPVVAGDFAMVVGMRDYGPTWTEITRHLPLISGERAVRRDFLLAMPEEVFRGFGVEVAMNDAIFRLGGRTGTVVLTGLSIVLKWEKTPEKGVADMLRMGTEVTRAMVAAKRRASVGEADLANVVEAPPPASVTAECDSTDCVMDKLAGSIVRAAGPFARDELWTPEVQERVGHVVGKRVATPLWISACCGSYMLLGPIGLCATGVAFLFTTTTVE
jgi:hypothetical protein